MRVIFSEMFGTKLPYNLRTIPSAHAPDLHFVDITGDDLIPIVSITVQSFLYSVRLQCIALKLSNSNPVKNMCPQM